MAKFAERQLDKIIEFAFETRPPFAKWFLSRTKFNCRAAQRCYAKSEHSEGFRTSRVSAYRALSFLIKADGGASEPFESRASRRRAPMPNC
jgi:hypothetical protein